MNKILNFVRTNKLIVITKRERQTERDREREREVIIMNTQM